MRIAFKMKVYWSTERTQGIHHDVVMLIKIEVVDVITHKSVFVFLYKRLSRLFNCCITLYTVRYPQSGMSGPGFEGILCHVILSQYNFF